MRWQGCAEHYLLPSQIQFFQSSNSTEDMQCNAMQCNAMQCLNAHYGCRASLEYLKVTGAKPDIIHVHEWQTSAVPMLYWEAYANQGLPGARLVLTIHCLDNSGECREDEFAFTGD